VRTSTGAISHSPGWTLIRRDMSGNVGAELSVALYFRVVGEREPQSYRWMFAAPVAAVGSIQAYGGVSSRRPVDAHRGLYSPDATRFAAPFDDGALLLPRQGAARLHVVGSAPPASITLSLASPVTRTHT